MANDILKDEILKESELDSISGGTFGDTIDDSKFLYEYGLSDDWHGNIHTWFNWKSDSSAVDAGWAKAGITCVTKPGDNNDNKYFMNGKEITRNDAVAHVQANFNKIRNV